MTDEQPWTQLALWEGERLRAEVWLDTAVGGWRWHVKHADATHNWSTVDDGCVGSPERAFLNVSQVLDNLSGF